jgi:hypothetical protein
MNKRHPVVLIVLVYTALLFSPPAHAQLPQQGPKLVGTGAVGSAYQGTAVALSADGNTAIIGGDGDNRFAGAAWVWARSAGAWTQQGAKLVGSDAVGNASQGSSVALAADGNTAIVGGYFDNGGGGAAWVWTRSGGLWTQQGAKLVGSNAVGNARQGSSVAISADGNTAIVGGVYDDGGFDGKGAAWVWTRSGGLWTQQGTKLVGSGATGDYGCQQGISVALSADGNTAIVGGDHDGNLSGAVWIWTRSGGVWTQQGTKLVGSGAELQFYGIGPYQGVSVALSADGNTAIVGAPRDGIGATWVWTRRGGVWSQQGSKLVGYGGAQGYSVSLSADGDTAVVGGPAYPFEIDPYFPAPGGASVWRRSGGIWIRQGTELVGSGGEGAQQGTCVSISADGNTVIVGGPNANGQVGAAWIFAADAVPPRRRGVRH